MNLYTYMLRFQRVLHFFLFRTSVLQVTCNSVSLPSVAIGARKLMSLRVTTAATQTLEGSVRWPLPMWYPWVCVICALGTDEE